MSDFTVNVEYDDIAIRSALNNLVDAATDLEPVFASIGEYLIPVHEERWEQGVNSMGFAWAELTDETRKRKKTSRILFEEGDLLRGPVYFATHDQLEFGITDHKASWHHFGVTENNLPARELLGINETDETEILAIMSDYLLDSINP